VKLPSGKQTLCVLPNKFNKKLWIKRGGYLIIQHGDVDLQHSVTGTITAVLYDQDIRHLKSLQGVWWVPERLRCCRPVLSQDTNMLRLWQPD
jgi:translation initiation factor IF-1